MARFDTSGIDDIIKDVSGLGEAAEDVADEMLMAAAEVVKKEWKNSAEKHKLHATGDMIASIGYPKAPKTVSGIRTIDIYPQGKDRRGVRNAEKAFVHHYGTSKIKATHWVDDADQASEPKVQEAMEEIYDKELKQKGLV